MFRSLRLEHSLRLAVFALLGLGCSSTAEWEKKSGELQVFAAPLPPVAGEPLILGIRAVNVGPIEVFQDDALIATFFNLDLRELKAYEVRAVSSATPRAKAVAFDFESLTVNARAFDGAPPAVQPNLVPEEVVGDAGP